MDTTIANIILATIGGFGVGGLFITPMAVEMISPAARRGHAEGDGGIPFRLKPRWCYPWCPGLFGAVVATILAAVYGAALDPAGAILTYCALGGVGGAFGGACSVCIQSAAARV